MTVVIEMSKVKQGIYSLLVKEENEKVSRYPRITKTELRSKVHDAIRVLGS